MNNEATIYGKRDGVLTGIAVIAGEDKANVLKQTRGWKQGVVHGVAMLPRNQLWKPESAAWLLYLVTQFVFGCVYF
jgi:hypothetical protein